MVGKQNERRIFLHNAITSTPKLIVVIIAHLDFRTRIVLLLLFSVCSESQAKKDQHCDKSVCCHCNVFFHQLNGKLIINRKREPTMPHLIGGPEKAHDADVTIAAHAMHVRTTMLSLASNRKFLRFPITR